MTSRAVWHTILHAGQAWAYNRQTLTRSSLCFVQPTRRTPELRRARWLSIPSHLNASTSTIFALSTAPGRSAIAVIRVSGPACLSIYRALCPGKADPTHRQAIIRTLYQPVSSQGDKATGEGSSEPAPESVLDRNALLLYFTAPRTATGEDVLELHVHGGPAIVQAVLRAIPRCTSDFLVTYAEPGEFTRRAFHNGKLALTQVEALSDALSADTEQQRRLAIRGSGGQLAKRYEDWRMKLLYARGELEALIDFSEDEHFDESIPELLGSVSSQVQLLLAPLQAHVSNAMRGELLRNGIVLSLLGAPNAGKSSLLNRIVGREAAIVHAEAGTTRDVVEVSVDLEGYLCRLGDTAGLRGQQTAAGEAQIGMVEQDGIKRAKERAMTSDVVVVVLDVEYGGQTRLDAEVCSMAAKLQQEKDNVLVVLNKTDLLDNAQSIEAELTRVQTAIPGLDRARICPLTCVNSQDSGIKDFLHTLTSLFGRITASLQSDTDFTATTADPRAWQESIGATERHRLLLEQTIDALQAFLHVAQQGGLADEANDDDSTIVIAAEHLRDAADSLARITGRGQGGDVEEVLGVVFEKFCVGK